MNSVKSAVQSGSGSDGTVGACSTVLGFFLAEAVCCHGFGLQCGHCSPKPASAHWCSAGLVAEVWAVIRVGQLDRRGQGMDIWMDLTLALPVFDVASCLTGLGTYLS